MSSRQRRTIWTGVLGGIALAGIGIALAQAQRQRAAAPRSQAPVRARSAVVDGIQISWEQHGSEPGEGVPVVLVHGLPTNPRAWRHVVPLLEGSGAACLAWEQVGFGSSLREGLGRDLSIPAQAIYLRSWLHHLGIERAVFVGHDYGGGVVQQLAADKPELFLGLVLTDSVAFDNWPVLAVRFARGLRSQIEAMPLLLVKALFAAALANLGHTDSAIARESREVFWRPYAEGPGRQALVHQLRHFWSGYTIPIGERLRPLGCPTIIVWGERDPLGLRSAQRLAEVLQAELRVVSGAYHFTIEDHPGEIAEAILSVVRRVSPGKARAMSADPDTAAGRGA